MDETGLQNPIFKIANLNQQSNFQNNQGMNFNMANSLNQNMMSDQTNMMNMMNQMQNTGMMNNGMMNNGMMNNGMMMNIPMMMNNGMMMNNLMMSMTGMNNPNNNPNNVQPSSGGQSAEEEGISLNFRINGEGKGNQGRLVSIQCKLDEKVDDIITRFCNKAGIKDSEKKFVYNAKNLNRDLSAAEAGLIHNANIFVISTKGVKGAQN